MDSYPGDLLAGVFPLVFAVDAILPSPSSHIPFKDEEDHESSEEEGQKEETESSNAADDAVQVEKKPHLSSTQTRSLFDRFLDVAAAGLVDEEQSVQQSVRSSLGSRNGNGGDNTSDDEDDFSSYTDNTSRRGSFRRNSPIKAFHNKRRHTMSTNSTAFARVLSTETFFQRARVLSVSIRHGFPPSKDPEGAKNRTIVLSQARAAITQGATGANALRLKNFVENQPSPDGILPSGWLEKHVHALPSVLLVVTTCSSRDQEEQNKYFLETMEHLKESMAPKRECHIHVVCLVENEPSISVFTTDAWITMARHYTELPPTSITLLSTNDLKVDIPTSIDFRVLIITIRDASLSYYLQQARRAKKKHAVLGHEQQPKLLPLAARYCFKIGIFYEFQLKHEKSLKFFALSYRYTQLYYQFLLNGSPLPPDVVNPQEHHIPQVTDEEAESDYETGIEVSLADASDEEEERKEEVTPMPPPTELKKVVSSGEAPYDMTHQCRAVADWLNFKILQAGFMATALGETDGLLAASWQWRKHAQVMLRNDDHTNPCWNYWSFVVHQRLVMSQLVERHPPSGEGVPEEVLIRCSPWRNYLAAAEAELNLDAELQKELSNDASLADKLGGRSMRQKFVGRLDSDGLFPKLHKESKKNHTDNALTLIARAIELFEREVDKTAKKDSEHGEEEKRPFLPSGARLYYMRGGILLHLQRYQDAILNLKKAARHCTKWDGLQDFIRQMLVACYDKCMPPLDEAADSSDMLDTLFHSGLGLQDLRRLLDSYSSVRGNDALKWQVECQGESDTLSPFSFSVTFPGSTHATAGDTVTASIAIKSNLNYSAHVKSVTLWSMSGQITVPSSDLAIAENADKGIEGGILVHPKTVVSISTDFGLPADLDKIAPAGSGGSSDHDGKGSSAATARPRIAGVCSGAGARLVSEERFGFSERGGQWSKSLLGGKVLRCDKMRLLFAPVYEEKLNADEGTKFIEVSIEKKKPKTVAPAKRTPFEENNYVESAWSRPRYLPLSRGPCCLRVLGPMPQMTVTNLTDPMINGKALEGTVNRLFFKLQAGKGEHCYDVTYKIGCSSMLLSSDGATTHLSPEKGVPLLTDSELKIDTSGMRTPVFVSPDASRNAKRTTEFGYDLPLGWRLVGTGHGSDEMTPSVSNLKPGECTYIYFELYRPPRSLQPVENQYDGDGDGTTDNEESKVCRTDFDIEITYRHARPAIQKRMDPNRSGEKQEESGLSDSVVCKHSGTLVWESPISAEFFVDGRSHRAFPSGSRHPSNYVSTENLSSVDNDEHSELALIHGERTSMRCVFAPNVADDGMGVEIVRIGFEEKDGAIDKGDAACELRLTSTSQPGAPGVLYTPSENHMSRRLVEGSKLGITYTVEPRILDPYMKGSVTARLGVLWVDWNPLSIPLPDDLSVSPSTSDSNFRTLTSHGPLRMIETPTVKFRGPPCYIENAPFETVIESLPPAPRVATPFEMSYRISNKTGMHQKLSVLMSDQSPGDGSRSSLSEGVLVSGLVHGDIHLAPFESQTLFYTALVSKAGKTTMPALLISCDRYKTWIIKDEPESSRVVFVMP